MTLYAPASTRDDALALHRQGRMAEAEALYRTILAENPVQADILYMSAVARLSLGDRTGAASRARAAVAADPASAGLLFLQANSVGERGDRQAAVVALCRAIRIEPAYIQAYEALAGLTGGSGRTHEAAPFIRRLLLFRPDHAVGLHRLAEAEQAAGRLPEAARLCSRAVSLDGGADLVGTFRLGAVSERLGRRDVAERAFRLCLIHHPTCAEALFNLANRTTGRARDDRVATLFYRAAAAVNPDFTEAHAGLGILFYARAQLPEALAAFCRALILSPSNEETLLNAANALQFLGRVDEAVACLERASTVAPRRQDVLSNLLFCLCFKEGLSGTDLLARHRLFEERFGRPLAPLARPHPNDPDPERRLRIGFVSAGFRRHPAGSSLLPFVTQVDRSRVFVALYYNDTYQDDVTRRFRAAADLMRPCRHLDDQALAACIRADGIDVLVDASGHLADSRITAFALRPAPVQVSFPVYPATTGLDAMDYRIMDVHFAGPEADGFHSETLLRLPETHICYRPLEIPVEPAERLPMRRNGYVTFASFNNFAKVGWSTVSLWAAVLQAVPKARLVLKWQGLASGSRAAIHSRFTQHGIDPERIVLTDWAPDPYTPYRAVDLCLDPVHANGGTTTCDALWMGVPVVTISGSLPFSRVGRGHLSNVGLGELIAETPEDYVRIAVSLANDPDRLDRLRDGLRERFRASPLMDAARYTRHFEAALRGAWRAWCSGAAKPGPDVGPAADRIVRGGFEHHQAGRLAEAARAYREALTRLPDQFDALNLLGVIHRTGGQPERADALIRRAVRVCPDLQPAHYNRAQALRDTGRPEEAAASLRAALALSPADASALVALGTVEQAQLRTRQAETAWRRAMIADPEDPNAHMNLAWALLIDGRYREGWPEFEWRWRRRDFTSPQRGFTQPLWDGAPLDGRTILLHAEQGHGDTIQCLRYVPLVAARGGRVILECSAVLRALLGDLGGIAEYIPTGQPLPPFDLHCPLMSLPLAFGTTVETIPFPASYLRADPARTARWRSRMMPDGGAPGLRVGILWAGNPGFKGDRDRSPRLAALAPILGVPGVRFYGLQMGDGRRDMETVALPPGFVDLGGEIADFGDTAAIMANLDLVITSCTAPAHLAGALGVPTWVLLTFAPDWRWLLHREDSPWYASVRLFRQQRRGDWPGVVDRVRAELAALAGR